MAIPPKRRRRRKRKIRRSNTATNILAAQRRVFQVLPSKCQAAAYRWTISMPLLRYGRKFQGWERDGVQWDKRSEGVKRTKCETSLLRSLKACRKIETCRNAMGSACSLGSGSSAKIDHRLGKLPAKQIRGCAGSRIAVVIINMYRVLIPTRS